MRHIVPISGKDSLATALIQTAYQPDLPYEFIFNDTSAELPETYAWLDNIEVKTGWTIKRIGKSLEERINAYNGFLPNGQARYCTRETKIQPGKAYLAGDEAIFYYGLRADEMERTGYVPIGGDKITPAYPLRKFNIDLKGVYSILEAKNLLPPTFFWPQLYESIEPRLTHSYPGWEEKIEPWRFNLIFTGRLRANCYFCFWQRKWEWLWLKQTHPVLFEKAKSFEKSTYFWIQDYPLTRLEDPEEAERVFLRRKKEVFKILRNMLGLGLFMHTESEISLTSCGLLCGK